MAVATLSGIKNYYKIYTYIKNMIIIYGRYKQIY